MKTWKHAYRWWQLWSSAILACIAPRRPTLLSALLFAPSRLTLLLPCRWCSDLTLQSPIAHPSSIGRYIHRPRTRRATPATLTPSNNAFDAGAASPRDRYNASSSSNRCRRDKAITRRECRRRPSQLSPDEQTKERRLLADSTQQQELPTTNKKMNEARTALSTCCSL